METEKYTQFDNCLLEMLYKSKLSSAELSIVLFFVRKTAGYHKEVEQSALSTIATEIGVTRHSAKRSLKKLLERRIILKVIKGNTGMASTWAINKNLSEWDIKNNPHRIESEPAKEESKPSSNVVQLQFPDEPKNPDPPKLPRKKRVAVKYTEKFETLWADHPKSGDDKKGTFTKYNKIIGTPVDPENPENGSWTEDMICTACMNIAKTQKATYEYKLSNVLGRKYIEKLPEWLLLDPEKSSAEKKVISSIEERLERVRKLRGDND